MIKEISKYIADNTSLVLGSTVFIGTSPATLRSKHVILKETGGDADFFLPDLSRRTLQVLAFGKDYHEAKAYADDIHALINGMANRVLTGIGVGVDDILIDTCVTMSLPAHIGQNEEQLHIFSSNYLITTQDAQTIS